MEHNEGFIGVACLVAKEVTNAEGYVKKFGLSFKGDIHWKAAPVLLDHLARSPVFKGVLVTIALQYECSSLSRMETKRPLSLRKGA